MIAPPDGLDWPSGTVWAWRADLRGPPAMLWPAHALERGAGLGGGIRLFHDGNGPAGRLAPGPGAVALWGAGGGYLSLAIDMPPGGREALGRRHVVWLIGRGGLDGRVPLHGRLNLRHGPDTAQQRAPVEIAGGAITCGFDLGYLQIEGEISHVWVDLIMERPSEGCLTLSDLTLCHGPRLEM
jgi:hypothetical protein